MSTIFASSKKRVRNKSSVRKKRASKTKKSTRKESVKKKSLKKKKILSEFIGVSKLNKIDKDNWIVFYYAFAYIGIFGLFIVAIYFSN